MTRQEMYEKIVATRDMTDIGTWMMEAIPETISELQTEIFGNIDEISDEESEEFYKALWTALFVANM